MTAPLRDLRRKPVPSFRMNLVESVASCVEADATGTEGDDLQQPASHRDVLEEVEELVLVGEIAVEGECGRDGEGREHSSHDARAVAREQREPANDLDEHGDREP